MLKPGQRCIIIGGCVKALGKEVVTNVFVGKLETQPHPDYWIVTGHMIPVQGFNGMGAYMDWAYVRDPHLMPIDPDLPEGEDRDVDVPKEIVQDSSTRETSTTI